MQAQTYYIPPSKSPLKPHCNTQKPAHKPNLIGDPQPEHTGMRPLPPGFVTASPTRPRLAPTPLGFGAAPPPKGRSPAAGAGAGVRAGAGAGADAGAQALGAGATGAGFGWKLLAGAVGLGAEILLQ